VLDFLPLVFGVFLAQMAPGPNLMAVSSISLGSGRKAGVMTAAGVASGVFVWAVLFTIGIGAFLKAFPETITAMKLLGGGYLLYLGARALFQAWRGSKAGGGSASMRTTGLRAFGTGFVVVLTNPKAALMWIAVSIFLASANLSNTQFLVIGACVSLSAMTIYGTYALLFSTGIAMRIYGRSIHFIEAGFGAVFGALGAKLITDGLRELRS
jgi:threonine/homoserine/homoserine lactone efflux protein